MSQDNPAVPSLDLRRVRSLMPVTDRFVFLNHAALAPVPRTAVERVGEAVGGQAATGDVLWPERQRRIEAARRSAARLLGDVEPSSVAFCENTSVGLSMVAEGLPWQPGDNVVTAACEYPSNVYPWMNLERHGVELRLAPEVEARVDPEAIFARVDGRTRVVALSWVQYATGFRSDLARLGAFCRDRDVLFVVDAIQGLGALRMDAAGWGCDAVAAAAHKWLLGPEGVAILHLGPRAVERIRPIHAGWRSMRHMFEWDRFEIDWNDGALGQEAGTLNALGILALGASLELLLEAGPEAVEARVLALAGRLGEGLRDAGYSLVSPWDDGERSGIVSVAHRERPARDLAQYLETHQVRAAHRAGRLRLAPHFYNSEEEVDRVVELLATA